MFFINPKNVASLQSSTFSVFFPGFWRFLMVSIWFLENPLVNIEKAIENDPVEIVDLPHEKWIFP